LRKVFGRITDFHRWLGVEGPGRTTGKAITGVSNLAFLFIVVSGSISGFRDSGAGRISGTSSGSGVGCRARRATSTGTT
jgi:hypothetical protein